MGLSFWLYGLEKGMCEITVLLHYSYENDTRLYNLYCDWWEKYVSVTVLHIVVLYLTMDAGGRMYN